MAQWLSTCCSSKDLCYFSSNHMATHNHNCYNSSSWDTDILFWPHWVLHICSAHIYMQAKHPYIKLKKRESSLPSFSYHILCGKATLGNIKSSTPNVWESCSSLKQSKACKEDNEPELIHRWKWWALPVVLSLASHKKRFPDGLLCALCSVL